MPQSDWRRLRLECFLWKFPNGNSAERFTKSHAINLEVTEGVSSMYGTVYAAHKCFSSWLVNPHFQRNQCTTQKKIFPGNISLEFCSLSTCTARLLLWGSYSGNTCLGWTFGSAIHWWSYCVLHVIDLKSHLKYEKSSKIFLNKIWGKSVFI